METEIWKYIPGYEDKYQVSSFWRVKSIWIYKFSIHNNAFWFFKERVHIPDIKRWYNSVCLYKWKQRKAMQIHRLVALTFIINTENKPCVNHINGIKNDNRIENLEWCTYSENILHAYKTWLKKITENNNFIKNNPTKWIFWKNHYSSVKVSQYDLEWNFIKTWDAIADIWRYMNIKNTNITRCCSWVRPTAYGFIWKYKNN